MTELGFEVIGVDVDEAKIARLAAGEVPFYEPGLDDCCARTWPPAGCIFPRRWPRRPNSRRALRLRGHAAEKG